MITSETTTIGMCLEPLDVLFFRDGRPFTGSERSVSGLPLPQTLAGAIRTALLRLAACDFARLKKSIEDGQMFEEAVRSSCGDEHHWIGRMIVRGPWLARLMAGGADVEVLVPAPSTLHRHKGHHSAKLLRLSPLHVGQLPGWDPPADQQGLRPVWTKALTPTEPAEAYLTPAGLARFLEGEDVSNGDVVSPQDLFDLDYRTGIEISPDRLVAEESQIFGRGFLSLNLKKKVCLYSEIVLPDEAPSNSLFDLPETLPLGGEGRYVFVRRLPKPFNWPHAESSRRNQKPLVVLTTPCAFQAGWKPKRLEDHVAAAAVPGSLAFSGWDLARGGPKPTRFAVPAGTVYFLESLPNDWAQTLAENDEDRQLGWGCCLTGVWTDE
ncbi:MAG: type III-B CRISPR module-associated protein Cmr3 [Acidobacteria bacterium]|nr:type III-B CRISPR module-associated protein Cmr3 [Acidobacteriota bacterium]MCI0721013.1 type III-B CRISPR module-associated protein Cmr3 [Acidobacteriota bacterium]